MSSKVDSILAHRDVLDRNKTRFREYKVFWKNSNLSQCTWETPERLKNDKDAIQAYLKRNPQAREPKDLRRSPSDEDFNPEPEESQRQKKRGRGRGRGRNGRPPKNQIERIYKGPRKQPNQSLIEQNASDGFNIRKQQTYPSYPMLEKKEDFKITGLFADINTQQVLYKVEEHQSSFYRTRKWVLNRSKVALIQFYESCIKISQ